MPTVHNEKNKGIKNNRLALTNYKKEELIKIKSIYNEIDKNGDGSLQIQEIHDYVISKREKN